MASFKNFSNRITFSKALVSQIGYKPLIGSTLFGSPPNYDTFNHDYHGEFWGDSPNDLSIGTPQQLLNTTQTGSTKFFHTFLCEENGFQMVIPLLGSKYWIRHRSGSGWNATWEERDRGLGSGGGGGITQAQLDAAISIEAGTRALADNQKLNKSFTNLPNALPVSQAAQIKSNFKSLFDITAGGTIAGGTVSALPEETNPHDTDQLFLNEPFRYGDVDFYYTLSTSGIHKIPHNKLNTPADWTTIHIPSSLDFVTGFALFKNRYFVMGSSDGGNNRRLYVSNRDADPTQDSHYTQITLPSVLDGAGFQGLIVYTNSSSEDRISTISHGGSNANHVAESAAIDIANNSYPTSSPTGWRFHNLPSGQNGGSSLAYWKNRYYVAMANNQIYRANNETPQSTEWTQVAVSPSGFTIRKLSIQGEQYYAACDRSDTAIRLFISDSLEFLSESHWTENTISNTSGFGENSGFDLTYAEDQPNVVKRVDVENLRSVVRPDKNGQPPAASAEYLGRPLLDINDNWRICTKHLLEGHSASATYRDFATLDLGTGFTWGGVFNNLSQVPSSSPANTIVYLTIDDTFFRKLSTGVFPWTTHKRPNQWKGPHKSEADALPYITHKGDVVEFGDKVHVVIAYTAPADEHVVYKWSLSPEIKELFDRSDIEANPGGSGLTDLTTIRIRGEDYQLATGGGGGGGFDFNAEKAGRGLAKYAIEENDTPIDLIDIFSDAARTIDGVYGNVRDVESLDGLVYNSGADVPANWTIPAAQAEGSNDFYLEAVSDTQLAFRAVAPNWPDRADFSAALRPYILVFSRNSEGQVLFVRLQELTRTLTGEYTLPDGALHYGTDVDYAIVNDNVLGDTLDYANALVSVTGEESKAQKILTDEQVADRVWQAGSYYQQVRDNHLFFLQGLTTPIEVIKGGTKTYAQVANSLHLSHELPLGGERVKTAGVTLTAGAAMSTSLSNIFSVTGNIGELSNNRNADVTSVTARLGSNRIFNIDFLQGAFDKIFKPASNISVFTAEARALDGVVVNVNNINTENIHFTSGTTVPANWVIPAALGDGTNDFFMYQLATNGVLEFAGLNSDYSNYRDFNATQRANITIVARNSEGDIRSATLSSLTRLGLGRYSGASLFTGTDVDIAIVKTDAAGFNATDGTIATEGVLKAPYTTIKFTYDGTEQTLTPGTGEGNYGFNTGNNRLQLRPAGLPSTLPEGTKFRLSIENDDGSEYFWFDEEKTDIEKLDFHTQINNGATNTHEWILVRIAASQNIRDGRVKMALGRAAERNDYTELDFNIFNGWEAVADIPNRSGHKSLFYAYDNFYVEALRNRFSFVIEDGADTRIPKNIRIVLDDGTVLSYPLTLVSSAITAGQGSVFSGKKWYYTAGQTFSNDLTEADLEAGGYNIEYKDGSWEGHTIDSRPDADLTFGGNSFTRIEILSTDLQPYKYFYRKLDYNFNTEGTLTYENSSTLGTIYGFKGQTHTFPALSGTPHGTYLDNFLREGDIVLDTDTNEYNRKTATGYETVKVINPTLFSILEDFAKRIRKDLTSHAVISGTNVIGFGPGLNGGSNPPGWPSNIHATKWTHNESNDSEFRKKFSMNVIEGASDRSYHGKKLVIFGGIYTMNYKRRDGTANEYLATTTHESTPNTSVWTKLNIEDINEEAKDHLVGSPFLFNQSTEI